MTAHIALINTLYQIGVIQFGNFTLKSGKSSKIYLDLRKIISYPSVLRSVAEAIWLKVHTCRMDVLCGVPYTALPIATCLSLQHDVPMILRRKEKKDYGTKQQIEGKYEPGQYCIIIEDVITTGGSILETAEDLQKEGLIIKDVAMLIDRQQGGKENLEKHHFNVHAVFTLEEIMQQLLHSTLLTAPERSIVDHLVSELN